MEQADWLEGDEDGGVTVQKETGRRSPDCRPISQEAAAGRSNCMSQGTHEATLPPRNLRRMPPPRRILRHGKTLGEVLEGCSNSLQVLW